MDHDKLMKHMDHDELINYSIYYFQLYLWIYPLLLITKN